MRGVKLIMESTKKYNNPRGFFGCVSLRKRLMNAISELGWEEPTPIQAQAIPLVLDNKDIIGQAQTGTGKTGAFAIPILEKIEHKKRQVQALVITPTRELAIQVAGEFSALAKNYYTKILPIYGGQPIDRQIKGLKFGPQIVIGTPGRLLDHLERKTLSLDELSIVVLDEADEMLDMGFLEDIEKILKKAPVERQTLLFSATMPYPIKQLANTFLTNPHYVSVNREDITAPLIEQIYYEVNERQKLEAFCRIIDADVPELAIVFCRTKRGVDELTTSLQTRGYFAVGLHGDMSQTQRDRSMRKFRDRKTDILVATDVAARGIDVDKVTHVINYDIPQDPESYIHRIGRTGRAGKKGIAITLISPKEYKQLRIIEKLINQRITKQTLPDITEIFEQEKIRIKESVETIIEKNQLEQFRTIASQLLAEHSPSDVISAMFKLLIQDSEDTEEIQEFSFGNTGARPGMVRLFMTIGRQHNMTLQNLVHTICDEVGISEKSIGTINIFDRFSFVEVTADVAQRVVQIMHHSRINGWRISVEPARAKGE